MAVLNRGRSTISLYSSSSCIHSHRVRFVLAEKGITVEVVHVDGDEAATADLAELNPYNEAPTLVDRDLVLYGTEVICEYLDERYPHPPLMPVDPVSRARLRLLHHHILRDWYPQAMQVEAHTGKKAEQAKKELKESILSAVDVFEVSKFLLSEDLTLVDCIVAPLLWRLPYYGVALGKAGNSIDSYAKRVFSLDSFRASLTEKEREMILQA